MLDESMFEDIHEIAENSAYLKAVEEKDVSLEMLEQLPPYEDLKELENKLRSAYQRSLVMCLPCSALSYPHLTLSCSFWPSTSPSYP
jgi:hypothetical protein